MSTQEQFAKYNKTLNLVAEEINRLEKRTDIKPEKLICHIFYVTYYNKNTGRMDSRQYDISKMYEEIYRNELIKELAGVK